jgi:hypothetical protein
MGASIRDLSSLMMLRFALFCIIYGLELLTGQVAIGCQPVLLAESSS